MANHCFDVVCIDCGRDWCEFGCSPSSKSKPNEKLASEYRNRLKNYYIDNCKCPCGSTRIVAR